MISIAGLVVGCDSSGDQGQRIGGKETIVTQVPPVQVKLPPPPSFQKDHAPEKYPDSSYSVHGLRENKTLLDQQVRVKGFVIDVYECPPCPKGSKCPDCMKPHFWLGDRVNTPKDKALMVTDYPKVDEKTKKKTTWEIKAQYVLTGLFARRSGTGFASADGLLQFVSAEPAQQGD